MNSLSVDKHVQFQQYTSDEEDSTIEDVNSSSESDFNNSNHVSSE